MADLIVEHPIANDTVYGVKQMDYTVDGANGKSFVDAVTAVSFAESVAIEKAAGAYVAVVRARQRKVSELGEVLAEFSKAVGRLKSKGGKSDDKTSLDNYSWVSSTLAKYGVTVSGLGSKMTRGDVMKGETTVQYEMDKEDNSLQQDIVSMQSFITKRDNAFSTASKLVRKSNDAAASTIRNF